MVASDTVKIEGNKAIDASAFAKLCAEPRLTTLVMNGCKMTPEAIVTLSKSKTLESLDLGHSMVNKTDDLKTLARVSSLKTLDLGGSDFGDDGLAALVALKNIQSLQLGHVGRSDRTAFTANGLKVLATLPRLESLTLHINSYDPAMVDTLAGIKTLKTLTIGGLTEDQFNTEKSSLRKITVRPRGKFVTS